MTVQITNKTADEVVETLLAAGLISLSGSSGEAIQSRKRRKSTTRRVASDVVLRALLKAPRKGERMVTHYAGDGCDPPHDQHVVASAGTGDQSSVPSVLCLTCGEVIKGGMVRISDETGGMRHVPGALVCRKGGAV